jgi:hypothetical protein
MLEISYRFDPEYDLSARDPVADLTISDGHAQLFVKSTYLDTWFAALTDACGRLSTVKQVRRIMDEPGDPLTIEALPAGDVRISFGSQTVRVETLQELATAVKEATESFLNSIKILPDFDENDFPNLLRKYRDRKQE